MLHKMIVLLFLTVLYRVNRYKKIGITEAEIREKLSEIVTKMGWDEFYNSFDILIGELIELKELEIQFKKLKKKEEILIVHQEDKSQHPFKNSSTVLPLTVYAVSNNATVEDIERFTKEILEENNGKGVVNVYRTIDDFNL